MPINTTKIKELSDQAKKSVPHGLAPDKWIEVYNEKFAELIVKECAKAAYRYASDSETYTHYDDIGWDCLPGDLKSHIEEHFGVE